jgi:hypothetical protein
MTAGCLSLLTNALHERARASTICRFCSRESGAREATAECARVLAAHPYRSSSRERRHKKADPSAFAKDFFYSLNERVSCLIDPRWLEGLGGNCGRRLRRPCRSHIGCYVNIRWARTAWIDITIHSQRIEHVAPITDGDHWWLPGLQERIAPRLEHLPKRHIGVLFVAHQVCRRHPKREGLQLDFSLAALKGFINQTIDLLDPIVSHGVTAN